jgi:hypothetical protein
MKTPAQALTTELAGTTGGRSLPAKLFDVLVDPSSVFNEVNATPITVLNWLLPTMLAGLMGALPTGSGGWTWPALLSAEAGGLAGTLWSALVLWFIGSVFLRSRFSLLKTLEVVGLTTSISVLGMVVTALLIAASGEPAARPALSLVAVKWAWGGHLRAVLDTLNLFYLWSTTVLAIGLARLSGVSFKTAAFWVFGYWICLRIVIILLG